MAEKGGERSWVMIKRVLYLILFAVLIFLSPLRDTIYSLEFFKGLLMEAITKKTRPDAPRLITPITKSAQFVKGAGACSKATILIYTNDQLVYKTVADEKGNFEQKTSFRIKVGDLISVMQIIDREKSQLSLPVIVSDDELKLAALKMEEDKTRVNVIDTTVTLLLSWAVLIIGGVSYFVFNKYEKLKFIIFVPAIFFLLVLSIYFGVSTKLAILAALDQGNLITLHPKVNDLWWKEIQSFEWGIVLLSVFFLWNLGSVNYRNGRRCEVP